MNGEVIKSFLVGLGFGVDETSLSKFNKAISSASTRVVALYAGIKVAAAGIFWSISKISEGFEQMGYEYRIIAPAINKALILRRELLAAYRAAGINITKVVQESVKFNMSLAKTKFALEAVYKSVASRFFPLLTKQMDIFRSKIYANMPKIQNALEHFVKFVFKAFEATTILGTRLWSILTRVYDFFERLDKATDGWSTKILAAVAAWKLLNLAFLTTPLGMILTGLIALLALYDDFQTAQEGGESFFDWKDGPLIKIVDLFKVLWDLVKGIGQMLGAIGNENFDGLGASIDKIAKAFWSLNGAIDALLSSFHVEWIDKLMAWRNRMDNNVMSAFGSGSGQYFNPSNFAPIGVSPGGQGQVSQSVSQQTSIVVQGSADPNSTAKSVAGEQSRINSDMARNMKGATR